MCENTLFKDKNDNMHKLNYKANLKFHFENHSNKFIVMKQLKNCKNQLKYQQTKNLKNYANFYFMFYPPHC